MTVTSSHLRTIADRDGAAVLDIQRGSISTLNPTAAYIWQALNRGESEQEIVDGLVQKTGAASETVRDDVSAFLQQLREQHMLAD